MIIEISQDDILKNVGTKNLFEKNNYSLNEETDIILNGDFDGDVIYDFFDYLKKKVCRINSITAPRMEFLPQTFFCGVKMVKKIIIQEGTKYLGTNALGACDIETLVLPQSLERYVSGRGGKGNPLRESKIRNIEFSGETNKDEQILRLTNSPDFEKMTSEEYEQFQKESAERIEEIEKKALERIKDGNRPTTDLRDYVGR